MTRIDELEIEWTDTNAAIASMERNRTCWELGDETTYNKLLEQKASIEKERVEILGY